MSRRSNVAAGIALLALLLFVGRTCATPPVEPRSISNAVPASPAPRPYSRPEQQSGPVAPRTPVIPVVAPLSESAAFSPAPIFGGMDDLARAFELSEALDQDAMNADSYVDRLCSESRRLRDHPPLREPETRERDAAAFMAPLVDYEKPLDDLPGRLHVPQVLRIFDYGSEWLTRITDADLAGLDFSWMAAIAQFDHWTLLGAGRLRDVPPNDLFRDPIPNYVSLQLWSKLRLVSGLRRGDFSVASREVRHLADLIRSQGILLGEMIAVAVYKMDARAREIAAAAGIETSASGAEAVEELEQYRRATYASIFFTFPGVRLETLQEALDCLPSPCVALFEGAGANRSFGVYGASDNLAVLLEIAAKRGCDQALFARVLESREISAAEAADGAADGLGSKAPRHRYEMIEEVRLERSGATGCSSATVAGLQCTISAFKTSTKSLDFWKSPRRSSIDQGGRDVATPAGRSTGSSRALSAGPRTI